MKMSAMAYCYSVLAVFHKIYKSTCQGVCFMEDKISYAIDKDRINQQKMKLIVVNRRPQYTEQSQKTARQEIEKQLFQIFKKYD